MPVLVPVALLLGMFGVAAFVAYRNGQGSLALSVADSQPQDGWASLEGQAVITPEARPQGMGANVSASDLDKWVRTIVGEDDGSQQGMIGVANVMWNRYLSGKFGDTLTQVVTNPHEFNAWIPGTQDEQRISTMSTSNPDYQRALAVAQGIMNGTIGDNTDGALYYRVNEHSYSKAVGDFFSKLKATVLIGNQIYYKAGG